MHPMELRSQESSYFQNLEEVVQLMIHFHFFSAVPRHFQILQEVHYFTYLYCSELFFSKKTVMGLPVIDLPSNPVSFELKRNDFPIFDDVTIKGKGSFPEAFLLIKLMRFAIVRASNILNKQIQNALLYTVPATARNLTQVKCH